MNKNLTELVFILDRSGSMSGLEADTIGGFNSMIDKQRCERGEALVSTVLFDHETRVVHDRVPLAQVRPMTGEDYFVRGSTALLDAVGGAIRHIGNVHRHAREEDRPGRTLVVITTDGMENASRRYTHADVQAMIARRRERHGWEFLFLGANIDAAAAARSIGIDERRAAEFVSDSAGTQLNYAVIGEAVCRMRAGAPMPEDWDRRIREDRQRRGR